MADRHSTSAQPHRPARPEATAAIVRATTPSHDLIQRESSTRLPPILVLGGALLLLAGLAVTGTLVGLIFFAPLILITSPIWVPVGFFLFITACGLLSFLGLCIAGLVGLSWLYRHFRGSYPPGPGGRPDRIYETARSVKDYVRDYGGYLRSKLKDVAPGA